MEAVCFAFPTRAFYVMSFALTFSHNTPSLPPILLFSPQLSLHLSDKRFLFVTYLYYPYTFGNLSQHSQSDIFPSLVLKELVGECG